MAVKKTFKSLDGTFSGTADQIAERHHRCAGAIHQVSAFIDFGDTFTVDGTKYTLESVETFRPNGVKCKDMTTGIVYDSIREAAEATGVNYKLLTWAFCKNGGKCKGRYFRRIYD